MPDAPPAWMGETNAGLSLPLSLKAARKATMPEQFCPKCHAHIAATADVKLCPACQTALITPPGANPTSGTIDHRGIILPPRHAVGGIITPR